MELDPETPAERQGRPEPNVPRETSAEKDDNRMWRNAMNAYHHAREIGLTRRQAFEALRPFLDHPRLADCARLMKDIVDRFPD